MISSSIPQPEDPLEASTPVSSVPSEATTATVETVTSMPLSFDSISSNRIFVEMNYENSGVVT